jgi:hypothetical protein
LTVIAGATVAPRAANGAPETNLTNHAAHNTNQPTPPPLPRAEPNGIQQTSTGSGKQAQRRLRAAAFPTHSAIRAAAAGENEGASTQTEPKLALFQVVKEGQVGDGLRRQCGPS